MTSSNHRVLCLSLLAAIACTGGCKDEDREPKYITKEGTVTKIDRATGEVGMRVWVEKLQKEIDVDGRLAPNAEILINGETARLEDVRVGDKVTVRARQDKNDEERKLIAVNVEVTRPLEPIEEPAATQESP